MECYSLNNLYNLISQILSLFQWVVCLSPLQGYGVELDLNWKDLQDNCQVIKFTHGNWSWESVS
jgi:hypothetical protein